MNILYLIWNGNILVTSLKDEYLERIIVKNVFENIYNPGQCMWDVEVGPQGKIYVALEDPGRIDARVCNCFSSLFA